MNKASSYQHAHTNKAPCKCYPLGHGMLIWVLGDLLQQVKPCLGGSLIWQVITNGYQPNCIPTLPHVMNFVFNLAFIQNRTRYEILKTNNCQRTLADLLITCQKSNIHNQNGYQLYIVEITVAPGY